MIIKNPRIEVSAVSEKQYPKTDVPEIVLVGKSNVPGYGYSKMSKEEQVKVGEFIEHYLQTRKQIALIIFLIDIRHSPTSNDVMMYDYIINTGFPCLILANKADKLAPTKVEKTVTDLQNELNPLKDLKFLPFSAEKKIYTEAVWKEIEERLK